MNDVLSMILAVMDHEADAYWCFRNFLATIQEDFMAKGMMDKLEKLRDLFSFMDPEVYKHFESVDGGDMVFCHRWLLLSFKREFSFEDAVRLFEILCSHHLELSSIEAEKARDQEMRLERQRDSTGNEISTDGAFFVRPSSASPPSSLLPGATALWACSRARAHVTRMCAPRCSCLCWPLCSLSLFLSVRGVGVGAERKRGCSSGTLPPASLGVGPHV